MGKLTAASVRAARHDPAKPRPVRVPDGAGLYLQCSPGAERDGVRETSKSWIFRYTLAGRAREMGIGAVGDKAPAVSLAEARRLAAAAREGLARGQDPIDARAAEREAKRREAAAASVQTFEAAARALVEAKRDGWRSDKHARQWLATLEAHAFPVIGAKPVASIATDDVLAVLRPVWSRTPETGSRLRQRIEAVLDDARVRGWRPEHLANPARWRGHLAASLPAPKRVRPVKHFPALPWQQAPAFLAALAARPGMAARALRFAALTGARTGAVRAMRWGEIDLDGAVWAAPGEHMKTKRAHRTPLAPAAVGVLREVEPLARGRNDLVFPGGRAGRPLSDMALSQTVRGMSLDRLPEGAPPRWRDAEGRPIVPHGLRSTFKEWAMATGFPDVLSEIALAHADKDKVRAAYARDDLLEQRRPMMAAWAAHCVPAETAPVVTEPLALSANNGGK
jgi:integrase